MAGRLSILHDPPKVLEGPQLLHRLIDFEKHSDACALDFTSYGRRSRYTYQEIRSCAASVASTIQDALITCRAGADPALPPRQHVVPILLPQSPALYVSQLAILESGGAFCPINLDAPKERIKFVVKDVAADLIITTPEFRQAVSWESGPKVILIDEFPDISKEDTPRCKISRDPQPLDLAYVMYTSGSSGTPKGVAVSHLAASQSLLAHEKHIPPFKRFLQFAAPSFDVSVFEIFFPLKRGCTLVGSNRSQLLDDLPGMITELDVDAAELTPTVVGSLLQKRANAPGLKLLLTIGEMLTRPIVEEFGGSETKESMLYGMYGPTEAAIHCTVYPSMRADTKPGNIGVPFDTVSTFIAAASSASADAGSINVLPVGELGELVLGGPQLAQGYLNREEQNKAAFIHSGGKFYYRTGDKARQLEDGTIEILGRMSAGQVKLRGQRIELGEIEEAVYKHPGIKTTSAAVISGSLVVFALTSDPSLGSEAVLKTCSEWLPKFMIPSEIILLPNFPYLPSGKVDKRKLESDYKTQREDEEGDGGIAATPTERIVKRTLQELLGPFSSNMRLAAAGLDSLAAIRVASKLRLLGFSVTTVAVLQTDTVGALAELCDNSKSAPTEPSKEVSIAKVDKASIALNGHAKNVEYSMPCTPLQSAMLSETAVDMKAYRNWVEIDLDGVRDIDQILSALHALAEHNPILRTGFAESQDSHGYVQLIWRTIESSQIENVEEFVYDFDASKDTSLLHPIRIQIRQLASSTKLLIHIHHALYDAWSLELLLDDLDALLVGSPLPSRPSFASVVDGYLDGTLAASRPSKDYWRDHLAHLDLRQIPNFHTRKSSSVGLAVAKLQTSIPTSEIETAAKRLSSSPQSLFQAAYALVLSSYLGSQDICFGTVFSGRTLPIAGVEDVVGPCLATLPIRVDISTSATLQDLVQDLNSTNRKHLEHSAVPLREIKSASGVHPRQQLFDTLVIWQQTLHSYDHTRSHVSLVDSVDNLEFNLTLEIIPGVGNVALKANYQESLLPRSQVDFLLKQVEQLCQLIVEKDTTSLQNAFGHLSNDVLSIENETPQTALKAETLASPVERIAVEDPGRPAIDFATSINGEDIELQRISYLELNSRSNQMAQYLLQKNVLPDELVCICIEKSVDLYTSILATAKVGAGYLPVTPDTPPERLHHILQEAKVKIVMAQSASRPVFKTSAAVEVVYVDEVDFTVLSSENITPRSSPENISYSVFTSGSTGTPKGVMVTQGNLLSNLDVLEELYPATKDARLLQSCSQAFDVSVFEIFFTWRIGACLCSAVKDVLFRDIENAIRLFHVTHLSLTPTVAALIDPENVPEVEFLVTAGEAVTQKVFNSWSGKGLYQGYGPSETTNICTVNPQVSPDDSINNIGPPFKNTSAFVLSPGPEFALVPRGGEGEFCFGGSQVFRGYMDSSQNVGKIIHHPTFGRLYRSGDFGRLMPDGSLAFTGRKDDQVKIRGQRVELGEINAILLRSPAVRDCITMVVGGTNDSSQRLVSFWTSGEQISTSSLECLPPDPSTLSMLYNNLESALPGYMIPSSLIPLSYLPSTTQGKIDKRTLVKLYRDLDVSYLDSTTKSLRSSSHHNWTELELAIASALSDLTAFPLNEINPDTSFFNLGIDSVSAIAFSRVLRQTTKYRVEISDVLKYPSPLRLAERISSQSKGEEHLNKSLETFDFGFEKELIESTIERFRQAGKEVQSILPCTPLQEAMLSAGESSSGEMYGNQVVFNISCDVERLEACWQEMVRRHEILRTCFISTDMPQYAYAQVVLKEFNLSFGSIYDVNNLSSANRPAASEFKPPYSLDLVQSSGSTKLLLSMHHALYDGVALSVLYEEVERLYHGHSLPLAPPFAPFLRAMAAVNTEDSDKFWGNVLKNCPHSKFPSTSKQPPNSQNQTRIQRLHANPSLSWIEESAKKHSTTLLAVCHAIWASLVAERLQEADVCFGNVVSGRTVPVEGIERLVAPCFNTLPSRLRNMHNISYLEAFRKLQSLNAESLSFQLTPLRRLQSKFSPDGSRLFDTLFILQQPARDLDSSIWSISEDNGAMDFPLVCEVTPMHSEDTLEITLHSHSSIIDEDDAHALLQSFSAKLQTALENPRRQLLSSTVKDQIVAKTLNQMARKEIKTFNQSSREMTPDELKLRDVLTSFTNVHVDKIGRDVSIFRLGLDSISAVQVAARLRKQGYNVRASDILEHPTLAQLSAHLASSQNHPAEKIPEYDFAAFNKEHREAICSENGITLSEVDAVRPCTAVQQGMIAQSLHSQGQEYVNSMWLELPPNASLSAFKAAWEIVCDEHEMLRTGFASTEDSKHPFAMITYAKDKFVLPWSEAADPTDSKASIIRQLARHPWSLSVEGERNQTLVKFTAHHALYDAQSIQMILSDVAKAYASQSISSRPSITHLLGSILQDGEGSLSTRKQFWEREENKIVVNKFPDLAPLRVLDTTIVVQEVFSQASMSELEESCRQNGATMQAAGQAAWARLLSAYIGEVSTTFGMTLSGRSVHEAADAISFPSIVTLPVRCDVTGTNAELLSRTVNSNALLHKHQFTPLTAIQKWAGYPEGRIFDTLFAFQKLPDSQSEVEHPWKIVREEASVDYAVSLEVQPTTSGKVALRLTFRNDLIPVEHAGVLLRQYDALLLDTLRNPSHPCDVAPAAGTALLSITPAKENELPGPVTLLHEFVERGAREWPAKKALEFASRLEPGHLESRSWTYDELNKEANRVAQLLLQRQVAQGQIIAICFDKCAEASFAIIGILKAGCAYVALDPNAPVDRLKFIVADSGAKLVLSAGKPAQNIKESMGDAVLVLDSEDTFQGCSSEQPKLPQAIRPQDTSYCLYTSGTTGTPKGCLISHENAVQAMFAFQRLFAGHWEDSSKWLQFASFHFDVSVLEQFWSWSVGICVATAPRDLIFEDIPNAIQQLGITHIDLTPSLARLLHPDDVPSLCKGVFITGGEQLKQEILDVWGEQACIYNGYGPTEATIGVTMYPRVPKNGKPSNIGPQFDNVGSFVLKPGTELPVLRGGIGELCVSGKLVGTGYLNRADLTNERFPTLESFNERVYRTGDLVRILHDGSFLFLGRADDQVKLRGQRLELSEINEVIKKSMSDLQEVVTLVLKHSAQQKEQLVTFFVSSSIGDSSDIGDVISTMRDACKARLPGYMVPTHFVPIKALPLNPNNKADAKQLAAMYNNLGIEDLQKLSHSSHQGKEWTSSEKRILDILAPALHVEVSDLTRGSTIFELGLDSISIIGFSRTLRDSGLSNAKLSVVKNNPTVEALVRALLNDEIPDQEKENEYVASIQNISAFSQKHIISILRELGIQSTEIESIAPCTPVQEGMIYRFLESERPLYFNSFEFRLGHHVDTEKLLAAWKSLVSHLQILRTKFVATDDGYAQVVLKSVDVDWGSPSIDYDTAEKTSALKTPFALDLVSSSSKSMLIRIFHGLYDGNSLAMLLRCLVDEYRGTDIVDYGPTFHSSLAYGPLARVPGAENFWRSHLQNWSHTVLPVKSLDTIKDVVATRVLRNLDGLEEFRKQLGVTQQAVIQAAWIAVLQTIASPDLTIGMVISGRAIDFDGADKVIGPLFNTVPFHARIDPGMSAASLISTCHEFNMQMQDFQHTPLKDIQKWSPASPGQSLFDTLFVFQRPEADDEEIGNDLWTQLDDEQTADYPLAFEATLGADGKLAMTIVAQGSVIDQSETGALLDEMEKLLLMILKEDGKNILLDQEKGVNGQTLGQESRGTISRASPRFSNEPKDSPFLWTKEAEQIRAEIASLAKVPEDSIQASSSIFELGLDSIDVIKLSSRLKKQGIEIPVSVIIKCQTIDKMAPKIRINRSGNAEADTTSATHVQELSRDLSKYLRDNGKIHSDTETVLPATPLQQTMVNEMLKSNFSRYFNLEAFIIDGTTDRSRLVAAVESVVSKSPILRTRFVEVDDPLSPVSYAQVVLQNHARVESSEESSFENFLEHFKSESASLAATTGRLFHVQFISVGETHYMILAISHALYDGASLRLLHQDIDKAYHNQLSTRPDFMPFLEEVFKSTTEDAKSFWRSALSNLPRAVFPRKEASQVPDTTVVHRMEIRSRIPLEDIENLCRTSRITLQTLGQTCWAILLAHLMGQLDVVFGSVLSCRDSEEANEVMFPLMNTVAVRSILHGSLIEMLKYMQDMSDTTRQYQHFPLGTAQALALASRDNELSTKETALFDTLFIYQGRRSPAQSKPLYESVHGASDVEIPVCVEMEIVDDHLLWTTACKSIVRDAAETENILIMLDTILERIMATPQAPAVVSDADGISICGLPKFQILESSPKKLPKSALKQDDGEWSDTELIIRKALHEVSGISEDQIHKDSTIFHLGLDSIVIIKLPALLKKHGIKLSVSDILRDQTISSMSRSALLKNPEQKKTLDIDATLAESISSLDPSEAQSLEKDIGEIQSVMPVTAGQLYMIRMWQATQGVLFYPTFIYSMDGSVDKTKLENAWLDLLLHHDILRTGFIETNSGVLQVVFRNPVNPVIYTTASSHSKSMDDLRRPPVALVVEEAGGSVVTLKLIIHHALYDAISLPILIEQLQSLYHGQSLPSPALSFKPFVAQSIATSTRSQSPGSSDWKSTQDHWVSYLNQGSHQTPQCFNDISNDSGNERTEVFHPSLHISNLKQLAIDVGVSVDALLLASISKIYAQLLNKDSPTSPVTQVVFGIYLANRAPFGEDFSALAAPTLNILPLCVRNPLGRKIPEVAIEIQQDLRQISSDEMSCASLEAIYEWTGVRVNFIVNILKDAAPAPAVVESLNEPIFKPAQDNMTTKAEVVQYSPNEKVSPAERGRKCDAYLPSIDVEIRCDGDKVDMGVFAPLSMLSVDGAESIIERFVELLV